MPALILVQKSSNASGGMSGWRTMLCGCPINSASVKPEASTKCLLKYTSLPLGSVFETIAVSSWIGYSTLVTGRFVRIFISLRNIPNKQKGPPGDFPQADAAGLLGNTA